jgi:hypothetical protein
MTNDDYKEDAKGRLVPIATIAPIDLERDDLVKEIVGLSMTLSKAVTDFKARVLSDVHAFVELSAERYNAKVGGQKGNITLNSFDGKWKILVAVDERIAFDERIHAAKALIDECIKEWTADSRVEVRAIIDNAFAVDKAGKINTGRVLMLRRLDIKDSKWRQAMEALSDSITVTESKEYVRVYQRNDKGEYILVNLDVAA